MWSHRSILFIHSGLEVGFWLAKIVGEAAAVYQVPDNRNVNSVRRVNATDFGRYLAWL